MLLSESNTGLEYIAQIELWPHHIYQHQLKFSQLDLHGSTYQKAYPKWLRLSLNLYQSVLDYHCSEFNVAQD